MMKKGNRTDRTGRTGEGMGAKAANMADWIESRLHQSFTVLMDDLFGDGRLTREERIDLSGALGSALDVFHAELQTGVLLALYRRHPYAEADPESPYVHPYGGPLMRAGRRLSTRQLRRLEDARATIEELVAWANYEEADGSDEADAAGSKSAARLVKSLGGDRIGGYAALWGDASKRDLMDEWFSPDTAEMTAIFDATKRLPLLYQHAADGTMKTTVVGLVDKLQPDGVGLWYEAQLTMAGQYRQAIDELIEQGALGTSSGTLPAARRVDRRSGKILRWPVVEASLTPVPAEPRMMLRPVAEIKAAFAAVGVVWPDADGADTSDGSDGADSGNNGDYAKGGAEEPAQDGGEPLPAKGLDRAEIERELLALELMDLEV